MVVDLGLSGPQNTGGAGTDSLLAIENVFGTDFIDTLIGDDGPNRLSSGGGGDRLVGRGGADMLVAGADADALDVRDGGPDTADCGDGADSVEADLPGTDTLIACESAVFASPPGPVPPGTPSAAPAPSATPAALARASVTGFDFSPNVIAVASQATPISALAKGGRFQYTLSAEGRVSIVIERKLPGRRVGRRCVRPRPGLKRKCTRYLRRGALSRSGTAGQNTLPFTGRIGSRALSPGSYRATIRATNAAGASSPQTTSFKVVRATRRG